MITKYYDTSFNEIDKNSFFINIFNNEYLNLNDQEKEKIKNFLFQLEDNLININFNNKKIECYIIEDRYLGTYSKGEIILSFGLNIDFLMNYINEDDITSSIIWSGKENNILRVLNKLSKVNYFIFPLNLKQYLNNKNYFNIVKQDYFLQNKNIDILKLLK